MSDPPTPASLTNPHERALARAIELLDLMLDGKEDEVALLWQTVPDAEVRVMSHAALSVATVIAERTLGAPLARQFLNQMKEN